MPFAVKLEFDRLVGARCGVDPVRPDTRGDPPIAIARPLIDQSADVRSKLDVADPVLGAAPRTRGLLSLDDVRARDSQGGGHCLHWESPGAGDRDSKVSFFALARSRASLRISTAIVLRPSRRSSSRTLRGNLIPLRLCHRVEIAARSLQILSSAAATPHRNFRSLSVCCLPLQAHVTFVHRLN